MAGEKIGLKEELISRACAIAIKAHKLCTDKSYLCEKSSGLGSELLFGFAGGWDVGNWFSHKPFGEAKINLSIFPSLKQIGSNEAATVNHAFLQRFEALMANTTLKNEV